MLVKSLDSFLQSKSVLSLNPFSKEVINGGTWRINFVSSYIKQQSDSFFECVRWYNISPFCFFSEPEKRFTLSSFRLLNFFNPFFIYSFLFFAKKIDVIICNTFWPGIHTLCFYFFLRKPFVFDNHNVEYRRYQSYKSFLAFPVKLLEYLLVKYSCLIIVSSDSDKSELANLYWHWDKIFVFKNKFIPSPLETISFTKNEIIQNVWISQQKRILLFFGDMTYFPNEEWLLFLKKEILPFITDFHLLVAGKGSLFFDENENNISYLWFINYLDSLIIASDFIVAPIFSWGGVKIKILHALALNKKVLTTYEWARGIPLSDNMVIASRETFLQTIQDV